MAPSLDGPIILDGETTREQIVEVYADRELATGCLLLFALLKALFVIFLVINLVSQSRYSFEPAIIVLVVLSLSFFEIRRKSFGKPNAKRAIENLPAIVGSVHGQIDELAVDLTLGENRIHYGWMPGLRLGVRRADA